MTKGIAVHPELTYVALRPSDENQPTQRVVIVAKDRLEYLKDIIGPVDVIAELHGDTQPQLLPTTPIYYRQVLTWLAYHTFHFSRILQLSKSSLVLMLPLIQERVSYIVHPLTEGRTTKHSWPSICFLVPIP